VTLVMPPITMLTNKTNKLSRPPKPPRPTLALIATKNRGKQGEVEATRGGVGHDPWPSSPNAPSYTRYKVFAG
jgi:hypothetical protein